MKNEKDCAVPEESREREGECELDPPTKPERSYTLREAAALTGFKLHSIRKWVKLKLVPSHRPFASPRKVFLHDLTAYVLSTQSRPSNEREDGK